MLRAALPFGQWFILLFLMGGFVGGALITWRGIRTGGRITKWIGTGLLVGAVILAVLHLVVDSLVDWNPMIRDDTEVVGVWSRPGDFWYDLTETITLRADHICEYRSDEEAFTGRWSLDGWDLRIAAEDVDSPMRFIKFAGTLRLLTRPPDDPDLWNGNLGLTQSETVTSRR